jgi:hypothetical protein
MVLQSLEQPSPLTVFPSSQALFVVRTPFPQTPRNWQSIPGVGHVQFASSWQMRLQPSPLALLPSSHPSLR